jgi:hypothetical protein
MNNAVTSLLMAICLTATSGQVLAAQSSGIVRSAVKAPIVPDGDVAGSRTDFVIDLDIDKDPSVAGRSLVAGDEVRVTLPAAFAFAESAAFPLANVGSSPSCAPGNLQCTTAVLLQGWPQNPVSPALYSLSLMGNTLVFTVTGAIGPNPFGPGFKQIHLIFNGFRNPMRPGPYRIRVEVETDGTVERGTAYLRIRPNIRPSINVTSVFDVPADDPNGGNPPNPNFTYQQTTPGAAIPLIWNFLLWDTDGAPFTDVDIVQINPRGGRLVRNGGTVGRFTIQAPAGAIGQQLMSLGPSAASGTPVIGMTFQPPLMNGRLRASFTAGSMPGRYVTNIRLNNGNRIDMFVDVVE